MDLTTVNPLWRNSRRVHFRRRDGGVKTERRLTQTRAAARER